MVLRSIEILEKEWTQRIKLVKQGITPEKTYQRSFLFYNYLYDCDKANVIPVNFANFKYRLIYKLEEKYGYSKEDLNIHSKPDATLYKRFVTEMIEYKHHIDKCVALIVTEKSGIAEALQRELYNKGIFVVDTEGIQSRYAMQIAKRYMKKGMPVFTTDDYDISGCFMMKRYTDIGVVGISLLDVITKADLDFNELKQVDKSPKNNHWGSINIEDQQMLRNSEGITYKLEIDIVMRKLRGKEFVSIYIDIIDDYIPVKDVSEVMITPKYPKELDKLISKIKKKLGNIYIKEMDSIRKNYDSLEIDLEALDLRKIEEEAKNKSNEYTKDEHIDLIKELLGDLN